MTNVLPALVPFAVAAVAVILLIGLWNMMRGGSPTTAQRMMRARVIAQFGAVILIMAALWITNR